MQRQLSSSLSLEKLFVQRKEEGAFPTSSKSYMSTRKVEKRPSPFLLQKSFSREERA